MVGIHEHEFNILLINQNKNYYWDYTIVVL